jgi:hypothetical protein
MEVKMLNKLLITTAISGAIITGAIAQSERQTAPSPAAPSPQEQSGARESNAASGPKFIASQGTEQLAFTKFKGSDVRGPDDASIGSVNDLLFDKSGKVTGVVIGVGGFLGIGAKNVAVDMGGLNIVPADSGGSSVSAATDPGNVKLKVAWTKDQLQAAPDFQYYKPPAPTPATTGSATQPPSRPRPQ